MRRNALEPPGADSKRSDEMIDGLIFVLVLWGVIGLGYLLRYLWRFACRWYELQESGW